MCGIHLRYNLRRRLKYWWDCATCEIPLSWRWSSIFTLHVNQTIHVTSRLEFEGVRKLMRISTLRHVSTCIFIILVILGSGDTSTRLTTFRTESLSISQPPFHDNPIEEAIWLLKSHFVRRHLFADPFWADIRQKLKLFRHPEMVGRNISRYCSK